jgi:hypothetical protein
MGWTSAGGLLVGKLVVIGKGTSERKECYPGQIPEQKRARPSQLVLLSRQPGMDRNSQRLKLRIANAVHVRAV